jgi:hypothetical protein
MHGPSNRRRPACQQLTARVHLLTFVKPEFLARKVSMNDDLGIDRTCERGASSAETTCDDRCARVVCSTDRHAPGPGRGSSRPAAAPCCHATVACQRRRRLHAVPTYCTIICRSLNNAKTATINECRAYLHVSKVKSKFIEKIQQKI